MNNNLEKIAKLREDFTLECNEFLKSAEQLGDMHITFSELESKLQFFIDTMEHFFGNTSAEDKSWLLREMLTAIPDLTRLVDITSSVASQYREQYASFSSNIQAVIKARSNLIDLLSTMKQEWGK